jgi:multicomponent Na+:H+ antiporter subunit G
MNDTIALALILVGLTFDLLGCIGLVRMPDIYNRLQASTKCVTMGTCGVLLGVAIKFGWTAGGIKAIMCIIFLLLTAPVSAHALARAIHRSGVRLWEKSVCDKYEEDTRK